MNKVETHWNGNTKFPPCGVGTGKARLHDFNVTAVPSRVTCAHCHVWMDKNGIRRFS